MAMGQDDLKSPRYRDHISHASMHDAAFYTTLLILNDSSIIQSFTFTFSPPMHLSNTNLQQVPLLQSPRQAEHIDEKDNSSRRPVVV